MADEQKPKGRKKLKEPETEGAVLAPTAKVEPPPVPLHTKSTKIPKLQKKNKSRLPRRQKKAQQKAAAAQAKRP